MATTGGFCYTFKRDLLNGHHAFGTSVTRAGTGADTFYGSLCLSSGSVAPTLETYDGTVGSVTGTGEASGAGYTAGGVAVTNATPPNNTTGTAFWTPSASLVYTTVTLSEVDAVLIFNNTNSKKAVGVYKFTAATPVAGTLTLTMPTNDASTGLIRLTS